MPGLASQGRSSRIVHSLSNWVLELSSGNCVWQINHHWGFPPSYLCILIYSSFFHPKLGWMLPAPADTVVQSALQCPKVHVPHGTAASGSGLSWALASPCCKAQLSALCAVQGMTFCWPGRGPSPRPLGELPRALRGNFHYLPTGQNDFAIDIGFIMSAIPFFENVGKTEKEWWQGGGNSISS